MLNFLQESKYYNNNKYPFLSYSKSVWLILKKKKKEKISDLINQFCPKPQT